MDALPQAIDSQTVLVIAAVAVSLLALRLVFRVLNVGLGLILAIVAIVLILQYGFEISPRELWFEIGQLPQELMRLVRNFG
ncbi:hypothetical protein [Thermocoleostomius sinensis]|uniref:Uncharacterized protein n=1 Tax=Thermocoleostomius sinensis A174 TaxID=2016057 RepID=A0A9E9CBX3_9CYAN|nr:hypothetical protein [Thermocoleostomius sinensis]WAL61400.1 hypothetical protein OXH18_05255 [Thermocoleostomius sinensis A174]